MTVVENAQAQSSRSAGWLAAAQSLNRRVGQVDEIELFVAKGYRLSHQWAKAHSMYLGPTQRGTRSLDNFLGLAEAAAFIGHEQEAISWLSQAAATTPDVARIAPDLQLAIKEIARGRRFDPILDQFAELRFVHNLGIRSRHTASFGRCSQRAL